MNLEELKKAISFCSFNEIEELNKYISNILILWINLRSSESKALSLIKALDIEKSSIEKSYNELKELLPDFDRLEV